MCQYLPSASVHSSARITWDFEKRVEEREMGEAAVVIEEVNKSWL